MVVPCVIIVIYPYNVYSLFSYMLLDSWRFIVSSVPFFPFLFVPFIAFCKHSVRCQLPEWYARSVRVRGLHYAFLPIKSTPSHSCCTFFLIYSSWARSALIVTYRYKYFPFLRFQLLNVATNSLTYFIYSSCSSSDTRIPQIILSFSKIVMYECKHLGIFHQSSFWCFPL